MIHTAHRWCSVLVLPASLLFFAGAGCGEAGEGEWQVEDSGQANSDLPCAGHGSLHGEHCHCEPGWVPFDGSCKEIDALPQCTTPALETSCRCEPPSQECPCPPGLNPDYYVGKYYCEEVAHGD